MLIIVYVIKIIYKYLNQKRLNEMENLENTQTENTSINIPVSSSTSAPSTKTDRIIVTFKGDKYDITDFLRRHPGGKDVLIEQNGKDIEAIMVEFEHSQNAYKMLQKYRIS